MAARDEQVGAGRTQRFPQKIVYWTDRRQDMLDAARAKLTRDGARLSDSEIIERALLALVASNCSPG